MADYNLAEGSVSYGSGAAVYEQFSQAEDFPGKILETLKPLIPHKVMLDLGCGTGKYITEFAPLSRHYYGLDISPDQLTIAKAKSAGMDNVSLICSSAENINLSDKSIDTVVSAWVIGTIVGDDRRAAAISEAERVLKDGGSIYLIENDVGGEFEEIRGRYPDIFRTRQYNYWLEQERGFTALARFDTYFDFGSVLEAKPVIDSIWGRAAADMVHRGTIEHKIVIYHKLKGSNLKGQAISTANGGGQK